MRYKIFCFRLITCDVMRPFKYSIFFFFFYTPRKFCTHNIYNRYREQKRDRPECKNGPAGIKKIDGSALPPFIFQRVFFAFIAEG